MKAIKSMRSALESRPRTIVGLLLVAMGCAIFGRTLTFDWFIFDDNLHIHGNSRLNPVSFGSVFWYWTNSLMPVTYTYWAGIASIFGASGPMPYRVGSLLLHVLNAFLVFEFLRQMLPLLGNDAEAATTRSTERLSLAAAMGAAIFLVHPVHVETVSWISASKDLLSFNLVMLGLNVFLAQRASGDRLGKDMMLVVYGLIVLGSLAKLSGLAAAVIVVWLDWVMFKRSWRMLVKDHMALPALLVVGLLELRRLVPPATSTIPFPWHWRLPVATDAFHFNLFKLVLPVNYHFNYGRTPLSIIRFWDMNFAKAMTASAATVVGALLFGLSYKVPRLRPYFIAVSISIIAMIPTLGLIPFAFQSLSTTADRYLYLVCVGPALGVAWWLYSTPRPRRCMAILILIIGILSSSSAYYAGFWRNSITQLTHAAENMPTSYVLQLSLSEAYSQAGMMERAQNAKERAGYIYREGLAY
jgi:protein O-mannosyl-transferase